MGGIKILHTGDLHLGASFAHSRLPEGIAGMRRQELWETFNRIIEIVKEERVELLLISGDLFEYDYCCTADIMRIDQKFREVQGVHICISPGNHDPAVVDSLYNTYRWGPNVHIFKRKGLQRVEFEDLGVVVWGMGWDGGGIRKPLLNGFCAPGGGDINILLLHCDVVGQGQASDYFPVYPEQLADCGVQYAALGHIHRRAELTCRGRVVGRYCGSPEPLDFGETGEHGVYIGKVGRDTVDIRFKPVAKRRFISGTVKVGPEHTPEHIVQEVKREVRRWGEGNLFRFELAGSLDPGAVLDLDHIRQQVPAFHVEIQDNTRPDYDLDWILEHEAGTIAGIFVSKVLDRLREERDAGRRAVLQRALHIGLEALNGRKVIGR